MSLILQYENETIGVVRNPYERIVSEFYCKWGGVGSNHGKYNESQFNSFLIDRINSRSSDGAHYTEQFRYLPEKYTNPQTSQRLREGTKLSPIYRD